MDAIEVCLWEEALLDGRHCWKRTDFGIKGVIGPHISLDVNKEEQASAQMDYFCMKALLQFSSL